MTHITTVIRTPQGPALEPVYNGSLLSIARPCEDDCDHNDCYQFRTSVEAVCPLCREAIGYDRSFFFLQGDYLHTVCVVEAAL